MTQVVVVTGAGRSGTSSVAGALKRLGLVIPQPEKQADEWNPRGYYESSWVTTFHARWFKPIPVRGIDTRPTAGEVVMESLTPQRERRFDDWIRTHVGGAAPGDVVLIKETRAFWVWPMWQRSIRAHGGTLSSLTMVRHPSEVIRSRDTKHLSARPDEVRSQRAVANVAGWVNALCVTEKATRSHPHALVSYDELLADWRGALGRAGSQLGLDLNTGANPHPVDDFLDPNLNRSVVDHTAQWDGVEAPASLIELAEAAWSAALALSVDPQSASAVAALEECRATYASMYDYASALLSDEQARWARANKREFEEQLAAKSARLTKLRQRIADLEQH